MDAMKDENDPPPDENVTVAIIVPTRPSFGAFLCCGLIRFRDWFFGLNLPLKVLFVFCVLAFWGLLLFFVVGCMVPTACSLHMEAPAQPLSDLTSLGVLSAAELRAKLFVVQLHGDSLMKNPIDQHYPFFSRIYQHLSSYNFTLVRYADYAKKMQHITEMINNTRIHKRDAIIVLGDADVTNVDWSTVNTSMQSVYRKEYTQQLVDIIESVQTREPGVYLAFCSPGSVLTEGAGWFAPDTKRFQPTTKKKQLEYSAIVRSVTAAHPNTTFIDLRPSFLAQIYPWRLVYKGCVTRDGEHANAHGTAIMAYLFAQVLQQWFYKDLVALKHRLQ